jgi:hypothetical protein
MTGEYASFVFSFLGFSILLSIMVVLNCIPTNSVLGLFCRILASICSCHFPWVWPLKLKVGWNLSVVLICISFIGREVEHFFLFLQAIYTSFFENFLFNSCAHFFIEMLILLGLIFFLSSL